MKILVSACLMGTNCKYDGKNNFRQHIADFVKGHNVIQVCPEVMGGRSIPRLAIEIKNGRFVDINGQDVDDEVRTGVQMALEIAKKERIDLAILKSRSPTCGVHQIYDGSFSGKLIDGQGALAQSLAENGFRVLDAEDIPENQNDALKNEASREKK